MSADKQVYMKKWREENKEHIKEYENEYEQTPKRIKSKRIRNWINQGIIVPNNNWDAFYDYVLSINKCQICDVELIVGQKNSSDSRCVDHNHNITDRENVRSICCNSCNLQNRVTNTSGEPNIFYYKRTEKWMFQKRIKGKYHSKSGFKTREEAIAYKRKYLKQIV